VTKAQFTAELEYLDMVHRVKLKAIAAFDDKDLDFRPQPAMRSPRT
jgi:hypothetical protein